MLTLLQINTKYLAHQLNKLFRTMIPLFFLTLCIVACEDKNDPDPVGVKYPTDQTLFVYMPWSTNLASYFLANIRDLKLSLSEELLRDKQIIVYFNNSPTNAYLYEIKYEKGECIHDTLKNYTDFPFTTAAGITSVLEDVKQYAPGKRYSMVIGCHGMGWIPVSTSSAAAKRKAKGDSDVEREYWEYEGEFMTRWFGGLSAQYQTDVTTLAKAITNAGIKMEYILFDDCYMSSIEVAYDLKDVTDYLIASPCEILVEGMPYAKMGKYMFGNVDYEGMTDAFLEFYENYNSKPCGTIAVTVCSELDNLAAIMKKINRENEFEESLLNKIQRLDGYSPIRFFDYGDYVRKLCKDDYLLEEFENQLERTVPSNYKKHTEYYYTTVPAISVEIKIDTYSGVTTSDPSISSAATAKTETGWYKATH